VAGKRPGINATASNANWIVFKTMFALVIALTVELIVVVVALLVW
jgi:hypothetical protein